MPIILCPHCGTANRVGSNFCNRCGADLRDEEPRYAPDEARPTRLEQAARRAAERLNPPAEPPAQPSEPPEPPAPQPDTAADAPAHPADAPAHISEGDDAPSPPTVPFFDLGLTSPTPAADPAASQPWLRPAWDAESAEPAEAAVPPAAPDAEEAGPTSSPPGAPARLVTAIQGLLTPLNISAGATERTQPPPPPRLELNADQARSLRRLLADEPVLAARPLPVPPPPPSLRIPWIFWLIGLAAALPVFLFVGSPPPSTAPPLPGVQSAYAAVQALPPNALVVAYWAYDPATAGEMDLLALPALRHLAGQRARLAAVSLLPGGPATARRLAARALRSPNELQAAQPVATFLVQNDFWPGSAAALSLLRQAAAGGMASLAAAPPAVSPASQRSPDMALIFASGAEDVQHWLEVVQPLYPTLPVVAFTSAAADPVVRPYLQSKQLAGLVTGYDGAAAYEEMRSPGATTEATLTLRRHTVAQGWSQVALLLILAAGSLAGLLTRGAQR